MPHLCLVWQWLHNMEIFDVFKIVALLFLRPGTVFVRMFLNNTNNRNTEGIASSRAHCKVLSSQNFWELGRGSESTKVQTRSISWSRAPLRQFCSMSQKTNWGFQTILRVRVEMRGETALKRYSLIHSFSTASFWKRMKTLLKDT